MKFPIPDNLKQKAKELEKLKKGAFFILSDITSKAVILDIQYDTIPARESLSQWRDKGYAAVLRFGSANRGIAETV